MIASDDPSCSVTCVHHSNDSRGIVYDHTMFIVQATKVDVIKLFSVSLVKKLEGLFFNGLYNGSYSKY
jgi:hypothetical protein